MDLQTIPVYDSMGFVAHYSFNFTLTSIWKIIVFAYQNHDAIVFSGSNRTDYQY